MASLDIPPNTLDKCCVTEYRPLPGTPKGKVTKIANIDTYHVLGDDQSSTGKIIVLLTDIFGLTKNPCLTADELSEKTGFDVYVPDLFNGDSVETTYLKNIPDTPGTKMSLGMKLGYAGRLLQLGPWLFRHRESVTLPIVQSIFKSLRADKGATRIQAVGYCFGGLYTLLAGSKQYHLVDSIVGCHVSLTTKAHFEQIVVPAAFVCAEEDNLFSETLRLEAEKILSQKSEIPNKFLMTEGTVHGFAARPNPDNPIVMKAYKQANDFIAEWAKTYL